MSCVYCEAIGQCERDDTAPLPMGACSCVAAPHVPFTFFQQGEMAKGVRVSMARAELQTLVSQPKITDDKASAGGFSLAHYRDNHRRSANVGAIGAIGLDGDKTGATAASVANRLSAYAGVVYTTHSHTLEAPRWRAIIYLSRVVTGAEHARIIPIIHAHFADAGLVLDPACKDASRFWYAPAVRAGAPFEARRCDGRPLDVDKLLALADEIAAEEKAEAEERRRRAAERSARGSLLGNPNSRSR